MVLLVVDGNSIVNRAFYGVKLLTTKDGQYTNAVYGFLTMLDKIKESCTPDAVAIAFDLKAPTFRHKAYSGYKANRHGMPEELALQMPVLKELLQKLGYTLVECEGYEADDILGTFAAKCDETGDTCVIATGDRDSLQLVSDNVTVRLAATKMGKAEAELYDKQRIFDEYGVTPTQMIEIKALQGDTSDNIPGVAGIGKKTAGDLIQKFGSIEYIYENIDTIDVKPGVRKKLIEGKENAQLSKMLGTIVRNAPIDTDIKKYDITPANTDELIKSLAALELFSLIKKWKLRENSSLEPESPKKAEKKAEIILPEVVTDPDVQEVFGKLKSAGKAYFIAEVKGGQSYGVYVFDGEKVCVIFNNADEFLKNILIDESIEKYTANCKQLFAFALKNNIEVSNMKFDTTLAAYIVNPSASSYDSERLFEEYNIETKRYEDNLIYSAQLASETAFFPKLCAVLQSVLEQREQMSLLCDIEIPLAQVLADMESVGFKIDAQAIEEYGKKLGEKAEELRAQIWKDVGYEFNVNSPKQLGEALFDKLGLPGGKKTKTGYSTNAEVLESLRMMHPAVDKVLEYRSLTKLKSTYCDALVKAIDKDSRIHTIFNQTETRTGRISSLEPNLQNIPVRTEQGRQLRKFFIAGDGCTLEDADYSQIELRVLAHIANDEAMIDAFTNEVDIHTVTASQVFGLPVDMVTSPMRSRAKAVNFGIIYGIGAFSLAKDIGVTRKEADRYIKAYLEHYSGAAAYMENEVETAKRQGYVTTMYGRRRYLPELRSTNKNMQAFGQRVARNMPIQGTAADIIKIAMVKVYRRLKDEGMKSKLILQVHDELIVESPLEESEHAAQILKEEMENAAKLRVPLKADANIGTTWYEAKG
ncbi:MAG: DNA polymerase I [Clostridia bacterium]|nr:DNA polymerase I [Clostridia bacterium]